jgi:hypothetical protein
VRGSNSPMPSIAAALRTRSSISFRGTLRIFRAKAMFSYAVM